MAQMMRRRYSRRTRRSSPAREFRYVGFNQATPLSVGVNGSTFVNLLTPTVAFNNGFNSNNLKIVRLEGHITVQVGQITGLTLPGTGQINRTFAHYAMGLYVDRDDVAGGATSNMLPLIFAQTSNWWWWRTGSLQLYQTANGTDFTHAIRRYDMMTTRRYQRKYDASQDSLILVLQNSANSGMLFDVQFCMRVLVTERSS